MDYKTVLVDLGDDIAREVRLEAAALQASLSSGHVVGLTALGMQIEPYRGAGQRAGFYKALYESGRERAVRADATAMNAVVSRVAPQVRTSQVILEQEAGLALALQGHFADIVLPAPPSASETPPVPMANADPTSLLVAGGYGHSRLGELVMGGTTHALMRHSTIPPLLLSH